MKFAFCVRFSLDFCRAREFLLPAKQECSGDEHLGLRDPFWCLSVLPFQNSSVHLLVLRIRKNVKAESGTVFYFTFPDSVMDFFIGGTFQLRKVAVGRVRA